ncbi:SGNH/GDSL hydrolase family protein [Ramlibacter sp.]
MSISNILRRFVLPLASLLLAAHAGQALAGPHAIDRFVIFGSSLSDTGNAFVVLSDPANQACGARQNVPPYDTLDDLLVPDGPYARGGHHFTDGATWAEGVARDLALAGNARPALRTAGTEASNFAVGGARAVAFPCRFNLPDQLAAYLAKFPQTSPQALVALEIGGNDVRDALVAAASGQDPAPYLQNALASMSNSIATLYAGGARRFLLLNVPDLAMAPSVRLIDRQVPGAAALATQLSQAFNAGLAGVAQYANGLGGAEARVLDINALLQEIVADPAAYGFRNTTDACITPNVPPFRCADPGAYVFWDGVHPTHAVHLLIAQRALTVISAPWAPLSR